VDIRLIAATSRDLQVEVEEGRFREDLFYRINVVKIQLPTLAKRGNDVLLLARHFIQKYAKEMGKTCEGFSQEVESILLGYTWPGNIRELQNLCRRAVALTRESLVSSADLPEEILEQADLCDPSRSAPGYYPQRKRHLEDFERDYFHDLLVACEGDVGQAVERSGVSRAGLYRFFKRFSLEPERFRG
jgi:DNA-binding NtrC family response regulator